MRNQLVKKIGVTCIIIVFALSGLGCNSLFPYEDTQPAFRYYAQCHKRVFAGAITFEASVRGGDEQGALDAMLTFMEEVNADMNLSLSESALSRFNAAGAGERVEVTRHTYACIQKSLIYYRDTEGLFNIAAYPLAKLWHVDTEGLNAYSYADPQTTPAPPSMDEIQACIGDCNLDNLILSQENGKYYIEKTDPRLQIDLGAVAKGYAADECISVAKAHGAESALINISGNISLLGEWYHPERKAYVRWDVGVTAPRPRMGLSGWLCALSVPADRTLVTSGDYVRYYETLSDGNPLYVPHIVNARTGLPLGIAYDGETYCETGDHIISATVICADSAQADAYATAVCLMRRDAATAFLRAQGVHALLVTQDGKMYLLGVSESDTSGAEYFIRKDEIAGYRQYEIEEIAVE